MIKVLVTGKNGQVARSLYDKKTDHPDLEFICGARRNGDVYLDLLDPVSIRAAIKESNPQIIINAAAYTGVDEAEKEPELAFKINGVAPGIMAKEASEINARLIQVSTDYVFDGEKTSAYIESDQTNPIGVYGKSKLTGELSSRDFLDSTCIVRTSWIYSPYGRNFLKTMLRLAEDRKSISVVSDQWGNPTSASQVADGLLMFCEAWRKDSATGVGEIMHLAGAGETNWSGFARSIFNSNLLNQSKVPTVREIPTSKYPTPARRPMNSRLNTEKIKSVLGFRPSPLADSIHSVLADTMQRMTEQA